MGDPWINMPKEEEPFSKRFARVEEEERLEKDNTELQNMLRNYPASAIKIDCRWGDEDHRVNVWMPDDCPEEDDESLLWFRNYIEKLREMNEAMLKEIERLDSRKRSQPLEMTLKTFQNKK